MSGFNEEWFGSGGVPSSCPFGTFSAVGYGIPPPNVTVTSAHASTPPTQNQLRFQLEDACRREIQFQFQLKFQEYKQQLDKIQAKIPILAKWTQQIPKLQREIEIEREGRLESTKEWKKLSEMYDVTLGRIPVLETRSKEIDVLKEELQLEREKTSENEKNFLQCIDKLMEEIVQLQLKVIVLEERIEGIETPSEIPTPSPEPALASKSEDFLEDPVEPSEPQAIVDDSSMSKNLDGAAHPISTDIHAGIQETSASSLSHGNKRHGRNPRRPLYCLCGHRSPNRVALLKHVRYHNSQLFLCKTCGKRFPYPYLLKGHNCGIRANRKRIGSKRKITKNVVKAKRKLKRRDRDSKSFRKGKKISKNDLYDNLQRSHAMGIIEEDSHGKPIRFYCKCGRSYCSRGGILRHIQEATLGKIFKCDFCPQSFSRSEYIHGHLRACHNSRMKDFKETCTCKVCGERFGTFEKIWEHHSSTH